MSTALKNIRRSPYQALAAVFIVGLTMFIMGVFALVSVGSHEILLSFETKPQIIAYLKDDHTQEKVATLITSLSGTQGVKKVVYVSKQDALELYKKSVGNDPMLLGTVTDWGIVTADILPASVEITAQSPDAFTQIVTVLESSDLISTTPSGKKEIDFPQDVVAELTKWTNAIRTSGLILVGALSLVSILTIMIIVSMKISSRRSEINTLKLLGAKNFYILRPYLTESAFYGLVGTFFGWLFIYIAVLYSTPFLSPRIGGIITLPVPFPVMGLLLALMLIVGLILAYLSGLFASIRFLRRSK